MKNIIKIKKSVAEHIPSGCLMIGNEWQIDYSIDDIIKHGNSDFENSVCIVYEYDDGYDEDDCEQEHLEDYRIKEYEYDIEYTDGQHQEYKEEKEKFDNKKNSYYGYCMNGQNGKREFSKMYGDGEFIDFASWLISSK